VGLETWCPAGVQIPYFPDDCQVMFYLHTSNKTENLTDQLYKVISREGAHSLFNPELFLIQSRGMERMLAQTLADRFGVWCNSSYLLPLQFIDHLSDKIGLNLDCRLFDRDILAWRLERLLRDTADPVMEPIGAYLSGEQLELKRYQLAHQLANNFDQYQIMRPDYLKTWQQGGTVTSDQSELWQKYLWLKLREDAPGVLHRGELIESLNELLHGAEQPDYGSLKRLFVFGVHTLPPLFLSTINGLSRWIDVHLFLLSPCELYWGDIESRRTHLRRQLRQEHDQKEIDPGAILYHPLLESLGRQGAHFQELLLECLEDYVEAPSVFSNSLHEGSTSLLHHLQADLLTGQEEPVGPDRVKLEKDDSIMVVSCHSRMREIMILKDHLLSWLHEDPTLELKDVIIMAPDIQKYSQLIPAVFNDFQHDISDCHARRANSYLDGFLQFLSLFSGRYSWSDMLSVLERQEVSSHFSMSSSDIELIRHWVIGSGIRWGLSPDQRKHDGLYESKSGTWRDGLERMLMGLAIDSTEPVDAILPFTEIEGNHGELLGSLYRFVEIVEQAESDFRVQKTLNQWSKLFHSLCSSIFAEGDQPELNEIYNILSPLVEQFAPSHDKPISFEVIRSWVETAADTKSSAGFLKGRLTFCSMLPMRSIPFRCICLLGLNDSEYPKDDNFTPFDLLGRDYRRGDRSQRSDDRYQSLEAILAARERLYLSYVGQSIKDNSAIPPSVIVTELLEVLDSYYGVSGIIVKHPLHPYNGRYFTGEKEFFSYDEYNCRVASALGGQVDPPRTGWLDRPLLTDEKKQLTSSELALFLSQPQAYFVRQVMGIDLRNRNFLPEDHELFEMDNLERFVAEQAIVEGLLDNKSPEQILFTLQSNQNWPLGTPGTLIFEKTFEDIAAFVETVKKYNSGGVLPGVSIDLEFESVHLGGLVSNCFKDGILLYRYSRLKGKDVLIGWLHHLLAGQVLKKPIPTHIVAHDRVLTINAGFGSKEDLSFLIDLYLAGSRYPSKLFVEPAFAYGEQVVLNRGRGRREPIKAAYKKLQDDMKESYLPESSFLLQEQGVEDILDDEFERLCLEFMVPLWDMILTSDNGGHGE